MSRYNFQLSKDGPVEYKKRAEVISYHIYLGKKLYKKKREKRCYHVYSAVRRRMYVAITPFRRVYMKAEVVRRRSEFSCNHRHCNNHDF